MNLDGSEQRSSMSSWRLFSLVKPDDSSGESDEDRIPEEELTDEEIFLRRESRLMKSLQTATNLIRMQARELDSLKDDMYVLTIQVKALEEKNRRLQAAAPPKPERKGRYRRLRELLEAVQQQPGGEASSQPSPDASRDTESPTVPVGVVRPIERRRRRRSFSGVIS